MGFKILPFAILATFAVSLSFAQAGHHEKVDSSVFIPSSKVEFEDIIPETVAFATVAGDREQGAHGTFVRIPAGKATPLHTHENAYHAVVIDGLLENPITNDKNSMQTLPKGSYYYVPANAKHITACAEDSPTDCLTYFHQTTSFDFAVAE